MNVVFREASAKDRAEWDRFVEARAEGDPLQLLAWGDAAPAGGEQPVRFLLREQPDGAIRALAQVLARRTTLGRAVWYAPHGPLWERETPDADLLLTSLLHGLAAAAREERAIVLKMDPRAAGSESPDVLAAALLARSRVGAGVRRATYDLQAPTTRVVELLDGGEALMATWQQRARNQARRSEREGVVVDVDRTGSSAAVGEFYALLEATAERAGFAVRSREFLERAAAAFAASTGWYTVLARHGGRAIAGMAVPRVGARAYYFYGASLKDPELKHKYAAYAAMAGAMRELAADGVRTLDMWGVAEPDDPSADPRWEGFSAFKRAFGGHALRHPGTFDLVLDPVWYRLRAARERLRERVRR